MSFNKALEHTGTGRMAQFSQRLRLDLANALARDVKILSHFFERALVTFTIQPEAHANYALFTRAQRLQHVAGDLAQV